MAVEGTLKITADGTEYDLGYISSYKETFTKSCAETPIVTKKAADTFIIESGGKMAVSMEFNRVNPPNATANTGDFTRMTNGVWYNNIEALVDRWQALTDGCVITFTPSPTNPYLPARTYQGYIKRMERSYGKGYPDLIKTTIDFVVGRRSISTKTDGTTLTATNFEVMMSNADQSAWYALLSGDSLNCIESYTIEGGMEQPFESITMTIPKNRLTSVAPKLVDNIVPGYSRVIVDAVGQSSMVVVKCKLSNKTYKITAYCEAEAIKGYELTQDATYNAWYWIKYILTSGEFGFTFRDDVSEPTFIHTPEPSLTEFDELTFKKGQNVWYVLQVCALYVGCKIFFAQNKAYCIDCRGTSISTSLSGPVVDYRDVLLYDLDPSHAIYGRTTGSVNLGDEGIDTVINTQSVECVDTGGNKVIYTNKTDEKTVRAGNTLYVPTLVQGGDYHQAEKLVDNLISYREEPQQSVTFTLKELQDVGGAMGWCPFFLPNARATSITSSVDDFTVSNESVKAGGGRKPQKLLLSQYERHYPEGTTTYTFGTIANVDLAVSTSQIVTNQSNGGA